MLLLATELDPNWGVHCLGQNGCIGSNIVSTISAVATCSLHSNNLNTDIGCIGNQRQICTQHMRVLCSSPNTQTNSRGLVFLICTPLSQCTRGPNGGMHLIGPDIGFIKLDRGGVPCLLCIALIQKLTLNTGVLGKRRLCILKRTHSRPITPMHHQVPHGLLGMLLSQTHHTNEVALNHHPYETRNMGERLTLNSNQTLTHKIATVHTRVGRTDHTTVEHALHSHVVHKNQIALGLGRYINTFSTLTHQSVLMRRLCRNTQIQFKANVLHLDQIVPAQNTFGGIVKRGMTADKCTIWNMKTPIVVGHL